MNHRMRLDENPLTPPAKGKGASTSGRCQAASGNDDATLAQKREYWRNKKREQRARLAKRRGKATLDRKPQHSFCPEGVNFTMSASPGASSSSYPRNDGTYVSQCRNAVSESSHGAADTPKEEWHQKTEVNKVFLSVLAEGAEKASVRHSATRVVKVVPSPLFSGSQRETGPSVPAVRVMGVNNGCSSKAAPPRASLQDVSVPQTLCKPEAALPVQLTHRPDPRISSPHGPSCEEPQAKAAHPTAQRGAKAPTLTEEEKAAKRREQWRLKKREQRAKTAAQRTPSREGICQRANQKTRLTGRSDPHPPQTAPGPILRSFSSVRLQSSAAAVTNMHKSQINVPPTCGNQSDFPFNGKTPSDTQRRAHSHVFHSNVTRCKTPRQRFMEVQKNLPTHRKLRGKSLSAAKNIPRIDPSDTPETMIAKRREYWRVKKREQRAKLTMEMKTRLREKDSLTRRVKRYQQILSEMRKARAVQASGAIGGFIREDGTLALDIPPSSKCHHTAGHEREEEHRKVSNNSPIIPQRSCAPIGMHQPSPPLPPSSASSAPALQSTRSSPRPKTTAAPSAQSGGPLKGWAPQPSRGPSSGPNFSRCVVKAAATRRFSSSDPGVSEEVRVAKKREYWRTKKREQRAALGLSAALRRRKAQRQEPAASPQLCRGLSRCTRDGLPLHSNTPPIAPQADDIKQEGESVPAADPNPQPEQAICPDKKPPAAPFAPPGSQQECADSQAATLLAVASMKKLLEESLSSVAGCKVLQTEVKTEAAEDSPPQPDGHRDSLSPISADVAMLLNDWQPDDETSEKKPVLPGSSQTNETALFLPLSEDKYSAQSPSDFTQSFGASNDRLLPCGVQGLSSKTRGQETCSSTEPPKLHHITQACFQPPEPEGDARRRGTTFAPSRAGMEQVGSISLQKKREYWKLMKRQQRARLKERRREDRSSLLLTGSIQINQILQSDLPASSGGEGPSVPPRLLVSQSTSGTQKSSDVPHGKLPATCRVEKTTSTQSALEPQQYVPKWIPRTNKVPCVPSLPALKPPENPLSSLNLQPFESPAQSPASITSSTKAPNNQVESSIQSAPPCAMLPLKLLPGESEKDFTKRKREYWRVKKKEQRAKKAIQSRGLSPRIGPSSWSPSFHPQDLQPQAGPAQGSGRWGISSEGPDDFKSRSVDSHPGQCAAQDESELLYPDNEEEEEEEALPGTVWRRHYLMDYDPLNQLLVCMVCGELQYSHSLEGVRAHIQELHPHSMTLEPQEKQQILEAWDEQVSQRERFFSRQLQHHSRDLAERNC